MLETPEDTTPLKVKEAAGYAGCGSKAIRNAIAAGSIPTLDLNSRNILIPRRAFFRWLSGVKPIPAQARVNKSRR